MRPLFGTLVALVLTAAAAGACTNPQEEKAARCDALKEQLNGCVGTPASQLDCGALTDADMERMGSLMQGSGCALLGSAMPHDGDMLSATCRVLGVGCKTSLTPAPERKPTKYPVILVNGIDSSPLFRYSPRIVKMMQELGGDRVYLATLSPYETSRVRAPELWKRIEEVRKESGAKKVNLICHSLGGLDCRYLASPSGLTLDGKTPHTDYAAAIASVTTVGTAHRGTQVADALLGYLPGGDRGRQCICKLRR
jgi:hypothetical protein